MRELKESRKPPRKASDAGPNSEGPRRSRKIRENGPRVVFGGKETQKTTDLYTRRRDEGLTGLSNVPKGKKAPQ